MQTNSLPHYDISENSTGCCPRFNPQGWDNQTLRFDEKLFVRATTKSALHIPLDMGRVFSRVQRHLEDSGATDPENMIVLSRDLSPWEAEHLFSATREVEGEEMTTLSGEFITRVFEGPYRMAKDWFHEMEVAAKAKGKTAKRIFFFYTTCPKCAKVYGENYVVGAAEV